MTVEKAAITDETIVSLYESGLSQKDIVNNYQVSVQRTRAVLQEAGHNTRGYRALNDTMKKVIFCLVKEGVYYLDIERVTDISFHALRDYVIKRAPRIVGRKAVPPKVVRPSLEVFPKRDLIVSEFEDGATFCILVDKYSLSDKEILYFYMSLSDKSVSTHRKALKESILEDDKNGLSVGMIARKYSISRAIIKKYLLH